MKSNKDTAGKNYHQQAHFKKTQNRGKKTPKKTKSKRILQAEENGPKRRQED